MHVAKATLLCENSCSHDAIMFACGHMMPAQIDTIFLLARPYILCLHAIDVYLPARTDRTMLPVPGVHVAVTRRRVLWPAHVRKISAVLSCLTLPLVRLGFRGSIFAHMLACINSAGISAKISHNFAMIVTFFITQTGPRRPEQRLGRVPVSS